MNLRIIPIPIFLISLIFTIGFALESGYPAGWDPVAIAKLALVLQVAVNGSLVLIALYSYNDAGQISSLMLTSNPRQNANVDLRLRKLEEALKVGPSGIISDDLGRIEEIEQNTKAFEERIKKLEETLVVASIKNK